MLREPHKKFVITCAINSFLNAIHTLQLITRRENQNIQQLYSISIKINKYNYYYN